MTHPVLEEQYFARMASSLGDKVRLLPYVTPGTVLDVGAGGGELALALSELGGVSVVALDTAQESLDRLTDAGLATIQGDAAKLGELVESGSLDTVVFCSVLHEVYSYSASRWTAVQDALRGAHSALRPGGHLIIRDGVMPPEPEGPAAVRVPDPAFMVKYIAETPHPELRLEQLGERLFTGSRHAVSEAVFTLNWGHTGFAREVQERYELFTREEYVDVLEKLGFSVIHAEEYVQPGYVAALSDYDIRTATAPVLGESDFISARPWFPPTNLLIAASRADHSGRTAR